MIRIQLNASSPPKDHIGVAAETLINAEHSTSSMDASTHLDTTSKSFLDPKSNGLHEDYQNQISPIP
jgi:hypothetical protein